MTSEQPIAPERLAQLERLLERLGVPFADLTLVDQATTHKSYGSEFGVEDYERLEFFGDAVLKFVIAEYVFQAFPRKREGELTEICAVLISARTLESIGRSLGLEQFIRRGRGVSIKPSIIAQSMEAILGALYLDSKFGYVRDFIVEHFGSRAEDVANDAVKANYKALLQEYTQARAQGTPVYSVIKQEGPPHDPTFEIAVLVANERIADGTGPSKKIAEQAAARAAMQKLTGDTQL
jgi:ribonuclease III